jgi:hypothetical protein
MCVNAYRRESHRAMNSGRSRWQLDSNLKHSGLKYKCDVYVAAVSRNYNGHATTAHNRVLRPQSSLRFGYRL